ncbi:MAG TPA: HD domain-containing protein [Candidatus Saccharimonadales bacterium]|nr:HD domain-containing protein [Candidatus Saccharimonadales bacterium]
MNVIGQAREIAYEAHAGQEYVVNGVGLSYFEAHLEPVANIVICLGYDDMTIAATLLHDLLEDTTVTTGDLIEQRVPRPVILAVEALTHWKGQSDEEYLQAIKRIPRSVPPKCADSSFNLSNTLAQKETLAPARYEKLTKRYYRNLDFLLPIMPRPELLALMP